MRTIVVLSGKGGVGKSSLTASLAVLLGKKRKIVTADCDVDAPNLALVLGVKEFDSKEKISTNMKAHLIESKCTGCKKCLVCPFGAITWDAKKGKPVINKFLCEGCGVCRLVCPEDAIVLKKVQNAEVLTANTKYGFPVVTGQLKMGESGSGNVVSVVRNKAEKKAKKVGADTILVDSSPGIGCPIIASIRGSDFVIAVTEPTPSAFADLRRALQVVEHFGVDYGLVVNRWDLNKEYTKKIEAFAKKNKTTLLGKLPYNKCFVDALVNLTPVVIYDKSLEPLFEGILEKVIRKGN